MTCKHENKTEVFYECGCIIYQCENCDQCDFYVQDCDNTKCVLND